MTIPRRHLLMCECSDAEHQVIFTYHPYDPQIDIPEDCTIYLTYHLSKFHLLKRLQTAIKYIFGYQSIYGAFGEILVTPQAAKDLISFINEFLEDATKAK